MATPLRFDMTLPNGEPLRWDTPGARWGGTVEEVMATLNQNKNMNTNKISAVLSDADKATALGHIQSIITLFTFLQGLTKDQKKILNKAANGRLPFIQQAYVYAQQNPTVLPGTFSLTEFGKDVTFSTAFLPVLTALNSLLEKCNDTFTLANSEAYDQALDVYDSFKRSNRNGEYDAIVAALGEFFKKNTPPTPPTPPGP